jgi:hypothetical protein
VYYTAEIINTSHNGKTQNKREFSYSLPEGVTEVQNNKKLIINIS